MDFRKIRSKGIGGQPMPISIGHKINAQVVTARNGKRDNRNSKFTKCILSIRYYYNVSNIIKY